MQLVFWGWSYLWESRLVPVDDLSSSRCNSQYVLDIFENPGALWVLTLELSAPGWSRATRIHGLLGSTLFPSRTPWSLPNLGSSSIVSQVHNESIEKVGRVLLDNNEPYSPRTFDSVAAGKYQALNSLLEICTTTPFPSDSDVSINKLIVILSRLLFLWGYFSFTGPFLYVTGYTPAEAKEHNVANDDSHEKIIPGQAGMSEIEMSPSYWVGVYL
jgi:hypothetical protein